MLRNQIAPSHNRGGEHKENKCLRVKSCPVMNCFMQCCFMQHVIIITVHNFIAPPECKLNHRAFLFFFLLLAGHNSSAWPSYAKGQLSAFSLSLASLREQYVPLPWFPAYLSWQCLRLPHCYRTQTPVRHLFYNIALCPANQYYGRR